MASPTLTTIVSLLITIVLNRIYRVVYFLYFSPLRHFPGPKLWAVSRLPLQIQLIRGKPHLDFLKLHKKYGPVIRIAPDHLAFSTGQAFKDIYGNPNFRKNALYHQPPVNGVNHLVVAIDDAEHARHRKLLASGFTGEALKAQEPMVTSYVDTLIQKLDEKRQSGPIDFNLWVNAMSFDLIGDLTFGENFGCLSSSELHPWIRLIFGSMKVFIFIGAVAQWPMLNALLKMLIPKSFMQEGIDHFNLSAAKADRRIMMGADKYDFMSGMMRNDIRETHGPHLKNSKQMSRAEIHSNAYMLVR
jgi:cytochrome P450